MSRAFKKRRNGVEIVRVLRPMLSGSPSSFFNQGHDARIAREAGARFPIGWAIIFPEIRKATRICVYDRAGLGRSDKAPLPRTSLDVAKDLIDAILDLVAQVRTKPE